MYRSRLVLHLRESFSISQLRDGRENPVDLADATLLLRPRDWGAEVCREIPHTVLQMHFRFLRLSRGILLYMTRAGSFRGRMSGWVRSQHDVLTVELAPNLVRVVERETLCG